MINYGPNHCPVCGMKVNHGKFTVEYHKIYFHCCSEQCLETFNSRPGLYSTGVATNRKPLLKHRVLHLDDSVTQSNFDTIISYLESIMGVRSAAINDYSLEITYDLWLVTQSRIEGKLHENNVHLDEGLLQRLRRFWIHSAEENELDNLENPPALCCNYPPKRKTDAA